MTFGPGLWLPPGMEGAVLMGLLCLFRVSAIVALLPAFGETSIPMRIKFAIAFSMTAIVCPATLAVQKVPATLAQLVPMALLEILIGLALGLMIRIFVFCLQIAGSIAGQSTSLSQIMGSAGVDPLPAIGHVITMAGLTLAMMLGLHVAAAQYIILSYDWMPPGAWPDIAQLTDLAVAQTASGFRVAFALAAPFLMIALLYNLTLGVINRAMPQLMVSFVGAPVITAGALGVLMITVPLIVSTWSDKLFAFLLYQEAW